MLMGDMVRRAAQLFGWKVAIIEGPKRFRYSEVNSKVNRPAHGLWLLLPDLPSGASAIRAESLFQPEPPLYHVKLFTHSAYVLNRVLSCNSSGVNGETQ
jgi:hypothetical protein